MIFSRLLSQQATVQKVARRFVHYPFNVKHEHKVNPELWKKISLFVAMPVLVLAAINTYLMEVEHMNHPRPEFKPYSYLYRRNKPYPWDGGSNKSFFHNPVANALPDGYEVPDPYYERKKKAGETEAAHH